MASASTPLRVGFLLDRWDPERGGAERAMAALASHLVARGQRVLAIAAEHAPGGPGETLTVPARGWTRAARVRHLARALPDAAEAAGCDVTVGMRQLERVDLYWPHDGAHAVALAARREARGPGTVPHTLRRPPPQRLAGRGELAAAAAAACAAPYRGRHAVFVALERRLLEGGGARRIACVSQLVHDELAALYPGARERLVLVPDGVDLERFRPATRATEGVALRAELGLDAGGPLLVFAGADARRKGLAGLLAALGGLRARRWTLLAAGVKHPASWARVARSHGLDPARVRLVPACDARALWAAADLCVLPTWRDACGLVVLEALAAGVPVVTTARAGAAEVLRGSDSGTVLERPDDVGGLRDALSGWLERLAGWDDDARAAARSRVLDRGQAGWLAGLEEIVADLARARP